MKNPCLTRISLTEQARWNTGRPAKWRMGYVLTCVISLLATAPLFAAPSPDSAQWKTERAQFIEAYEALLEGREETDADIDLTAVRHSLAHYPLLPYLDFAALFPKVGQSSEKTIAAFLKRYDDTPIANRVRTRYLYNLGSRKDWPTYLKYYTGSRDAVLQCYAVRARLATEKDTKPVLNDVIDLWLVGKSQVKQCDPAFAVLYQSGLATPELIWKRIRLAMSAGNPRLAGHLAKRLNKKDQERALLWRKLHADPATHLTDAELKKDNPLYREMILYGLNKLAGRDVSAASAAWLRAKQEHVFSLDDQTSMLQRLAFTAVQQKHDRATDLLNQLIRKKQSALIQRYQVRQAVTTQDWVQLEKWTQAKPHKEFNRLRWEYWRARSLAALKRNAEAEPLFKQLATERDYYGFLAAEELGQAYQFNDQRLRLPAEARKALLAKPAMQRARELLAVERFEDARREWNHATAGMGRDALTQASVLAAEWNWHDRTILTLGRAKAYDDLTRRFPLPYNDLIEAYAKKRQLPASTIYTLMRSESAFIHDVKSWAGAMGLMQIMPATAKQTARKIGLHSYKKSKQLYDPKTNITLGTAYLKEMLEAYDGSLIMAAAAYNAGPHRVKRWRPETGCKNGEEWVEMIPFNETRRYVRRALFYSVLYQWRMGESIDPIRSRLTPVPAEETSCGQAFAQS